MSLSIFQLHLEESENAAATRFRFRSEGFVSERIVEACGSEGRYEVHIGNHTHLVGRLISVAYHLAPVGTSVLTLPYHEFARLGKPTTLDVDEPRSRHY